MRVGILGSGDVAKSLARGFLREGYEVKLGSREPEKLASWALESGKNASSGTLLETAKFGEFVVIAVNGSKAVETVQMEGPRTSTARSSSTRQILWRCRMEFRRN